MLKMKAKVIAKDKESACLIKKALTELASHIPQQLGDFTVFGIPLEVEITLEKRAKTK